MAKKQIFFYLFYISCCNSSLGGRNISPNLANRQEPEPLEKKIPGTGAGAAWKQSQEPEPLKNYPVPPQPCME